MKSLVFIAVICALFYDGADGLKCYECTSTEVQTSNNGVIRAPLLNDKCFSNGKQVRLNECTLGKRYCEIFIKEVGGMRTITRGCISTPLYPNGNTEIAGMKVSYSSCQRDGCNAANSLSAGIPAAVLLVFAAYGLAF